jgi:hypothetical protein
MDLVVWIATCLSLFFGKILTSMVTHRMNLPHKFLIISLLYCFSAADLVSQLNPVYLQVQKNRKAISKGRREIRPGLTIVEFYVDMGYDDAILARLKKVGVDVEGTLQETNLNEKEKAVRSDCIVIGRVIRLEHPCDTSNGKTSPTYNTIAYVGVEEFLRNDYHMKKGVIPVMLHSGPMQQYIEEILLTYDEHVLLFLSAIGVLSYAEYNSRPEDYNKLIEDATIRFRISGYGKYLISSGKVNCNADKESKNLIDVKNDIKTIVNAIKKTR